MFEFYNPINYNKGDLNRMKLLTQTIVMIAGGVCCKDMAAELTNGAPYVNHQLGCTQLKATEEMLPLKFCPFCGKPVIYESEFNNQTLDDAKKTRLDTPRDEWKNEEKGIAEE